MELFLRAGASVSLCTPGSASRTTTTKVVAAQLVVRRVEMESPVGAMGAVAVLQAGTSSLLREVGLLARKPASSPTGGGGTGPRAVRR